MLCLCKDKNLKKKKLQVNTYLTSYRKTMHAMSLRWLHGLCGTVDQIKDDDDILIISTSMR